MKQEYECPKKSKVCSPAICFMTERGNFICCGVSSKPSKFKQDTIWLCLKGKVAKTALEMTPSEALTIITALSMGVNVE